MTINTKSLEKAIIEVSKLQDFLKDSIAYENISTWQFDKQCNLVYERLKVLKQCIRCPQENRRFRYTFSNPSKSAYLSSCKKDNIVSDNVVSATKEEIFSKNENEKETNNDTTSYYYDIHHKDKDKRTRNIIKLIYDVHIDLLKTIISVRHSFDKLPKEKKISLSRELIDAILESFECRVKKYVNELIKIKISKEQIREFSNKTENYFLQIMNVYIELYKKENKNKQLVSSISLQEEHNDNIKRIRKNIKIRKKENIFQSE